MLSVRSSLLQGTLSYGIGLPSLKDRDKEHQWKEQAITGYRSIPITTYRPTRIGPKGRV